MKIVVIESPLAGDVVRNVAYARAAMADSLHRGEAPFASHLLYAQPGVLDDAKPEDRTRGIAAGFEIAKCAAATIAYTDLGISPGMQLGLKDAERAGRDIIYRLIPGWLAQWQASLDGVRPVRGVIEAIGDSEFNDGAGQGFVLKVPRWGRMFFPASVEVLRACPIGEEVHVHVDGVRVVKVPR